MPATVTLKKIAGDGTNPGDIEVTVEAIPETPPEESNASSSSGSNSESSSSVVSPCNDWKMVYRNVEPWGPLVPNKMHLYYYESGGTPYRYPTLAGVPRCFCICPKEPEELLSSSSSSSS